MAHGLIMCILCVNVITQLSTQNLINPNKVNARKLQNSGATTVYCDN